MTMTAEEQIAPPKIVLTDEQQGAIEYVLDILEDDNYAYIQGAAGTGKTTLVLDLMKNNAFDYCYLTAPTNKAAKVLRDKTGEAAITIHKMLKMVLEDQEDKQLLSIAGEPNFEPEASVLMIVDEASMLSKELMEVIHSTVEANDDVCVLFIGDPYQLNPIGEDMTTAFDCKGIEITKVLRQAEGSPVIQLAHELVRKQKADETRKLKFKSYVDDTHIFTHNREDSFIDSYLAEYNAGTNSHVLAWRNSRVSDLNDMIRLKLHGDIALTQPYLVGEEIMFYEPLIAFRKVKNRSKQVTLVENSALAVITAVSEGFFVALDEEIHYWQLVVLDDSNTAHEIKCPKDPARVTELLAEIAAYAKSQEDKAKRSAVFKDHFFPLKNKFTLVKVSHAMTCHKSQGSTFTSVYVDAKDINANWSNIEKLRSLYVAVTRCSERLHIYGR